MTLGQKFFAFIAAIFLTGVSFQHDNTIMGWTFVVISVMLFSACMLHYLDPETFKN